MSWLREHFSCTWIKVLVFCVICWNTDFIHLLINNAEENKLPVHLEDLRHRELMGFVKLKVEAVREQETKIRRYSPSDYFRDLVEIGKKAEELGLSRGMTSGSLELQNIMRSNIESGIYSYRDVDQARQIYRDEINRILMFPSKDKGNDIDWQQVLWWFFWFYLKNLLPVVVFYLVLVGENRKEKKSSLFPNPLHFLWRVLAHPVYLTKLLWDLFKEEGRGWMAEARLRQTKENFFVYLSEDETKKIKRFAKSSLALSDWSKELLAEGLKPVHTLVAALLVTLVFTVLPKPADANAKNPGNKEVSQCSVLEQVKIHLPRISIDPDTQLVKGGFLSWDSLERDACIFESMDLQNILAVQILSKILIQFTAQDVWRKIFHIPILAA